MEWTISCCKKAPSVKSLKVAIQTFCFSSMLLLYLALECLLLMNICNIILMYRHFVKLFCRWTAPCKPALQKGLLS